MAAHSGFSAKMHNFLLFAFFLLLWSPLFSEEQEDFSLSGKNCTTGEMNDGGTSGCPDNSGKKTKTRKWYFVSALLMEAAPSPERLLLQAGGQRYFGELYHVHVSFIPAIMLEPSLKREETYSSISSNVFLRLQRFGIGSGFAPTLFASEKRRSAHIHLQWMPFDSFAIAYRYQHSWLSHSNDRKNYLGFTWRF